MSDAAETAASSNGSRAEMYRRRANEDASEAEIRVTDDLFRKNPRVRAFPGLDSYQTEDQSDFFGRLDESRALQNVINSGRLTVLHASSGAGKTSLLNATVIPSLEWSGIVPVRTTPQQDPGKAARLALLHNIIPNPDAERFALETIKDFKGFDEDTPLSLVVQTYVGFRSDHPMKRTWIAPFSMRLHLSGPGNEWVTAPSFVCRLLRAADIGIPQAGNKLQRPGVEALRDRKIGSLCRHITALVKLGQSLGGSPSAVADPITASTPIGQILEALNDDKLKDARLELVDYLAHQPVGLRKFLEKLFSTWGFFVGRLPIHLILDQFEEVFTLVEPDNRNGVFRELRNVYQASAWSPQVFLGVENGTDVSDRTGFAVNSAGPSPLPVRVTISLRDEWFAKLDKVRAFVPHIDNRTYHLNPLRTNTVGDIMNCPSAAHGKAIPRELATEEIGPVLAGDERGYVQPAQLQIVCVRLWETKDKDDAQEAEELAEQRPAYICKRLSGEQRKNPHVKRYESLGGAKGILERHFARVLDSLSEPSEQEKKELESTETEKLDAIRKERRQTVLEILAPLITSSHRTIQHKNSLINVPLRPSNRREPLLAALENRRIVRTERRIGGFFSEITHEFLIAPIMAEIRKRDSDPHYRQFTLALSHLEDYDEGEHRAHPSASFNTSLAEASATLDPADFHSLESFKDRLELPGWATEIMLKNAILHGGKEEAQAWSQSFVDWREPSGQTEVDEEERDKEISPDPKLDQLVSRPYRGTVPATFYNVTDLEFLSERFDSEGSLKQAFKRMDKKLGFNDPRARLARSDNARERLARLALASAIYLGRASGPDVVRAWVGKGLGDD